MYNNALGMKKFSLFTATEWEDIAAILMTSQANALRGVDFTVRERFLMTCSDFGCALRPASPFKNLFAAKGTTLLTQISR